MVLLHMGSIVLHASVSVENTGQPSKCANTTILCITRLCYFERKHMGEQIFCRKDTNLHFQVEKGKKLTQGRQRQKVGNS